MDGENVHVLACVRGERGGSLQFKNVMKCEVKLDNGN